MKSVQKLCITAFVALNVISLSAAPQSYRGLPPDCGDSNEMRNVKLIDYNDPRNVNTVRLVEQYHFTERVENLIGGQSGASVPADIDFVLRRVPNHYRALAAMGRWQLRDPRRYFGDGSVLTADCYFQRAMAFRPDDPRLHLTYAVYLHQAKRLEEAADEYQRAEKLGESGVEFYYNYGLVLVDLGRLTEAQRYADMVYAADYPLPGLRNKLEKAQSQPLR